MLFIQFLEYLSKTAEHFQSEWRIETKPNNDRQIRLTTKGVTYCPITAVSQMIRGANPADSLETLGKVVNMPFYRIRDIALAADGFDALGLHKAMRREMLQTLNLQEPTLKPHQGSR